MKRTLGWFVVLLCGVLLLPWILPKGSSPTATSSSKGETSGASIRLPLLRLEIEQAYRLAFEKPETTTITDREILLHHDRLRRLASNPDLWVFLGRLWIRKARQSSQPRLYKNAEASAQIALRVFPDHTEALNLLALVAFQEQDFQRAKRIAFHVLAKNPQNVIALGTLSDAHLERGEITEAEAAAKQMLQIKPNLPSYSRTSYLHWLHGRTAEAKATIRLAFDAGRSQTDREPTAWVLAQAALYFWHEGDYDGALAGIDLALGHFPGYPFALLVKGRILLGLRRTKEALVFLEASFKRRETAEAAWHLLSALTLEGQAKEAESYWPWLKEKGFREDARTVALALASASRDLPLADRLLTEEGTKRPDLFTSNVQALLLLRQGRKTEALEASKKALLLGTKDASLWLHHGLILHALGQIEDGQAWLRKALQTNHAANPLLALEAQKLLPASQPSPPPASSKEAPKRE